MLRLPLTLMAAGSLMVAVDASSGEGQMTLTMMKDKLLGVEEEAGAPKVSMEKGWVPFAERSPPRKD